MAEAEGSAGLAVFSDHTTAYSYGGSEPLGLVLCYAGAGIWFDYALGRTPSIRYAIVPHAGDWAKAGLWREQSQWSEPLVARVSAEAPKDDKQWSLCDASGTGWDITTIFQHAGQMLIRLFNAEGDGKPHRLALGSSIRKAELVELDGRLISEVPINHHAGGPSDVILSMPRFGVRTLRVSLVRAE